MLCEKVKILFKQTEIKLSLRVLCQVGDLGRRAVQRRLVECAEVT